MTSGEDPEPQSLVFETLPLLSTNVHLPPANL